MAQYNWAIRKSEKKKKTLSNVNVNAEKRKQQNRISSYLRNMTSVPRSARNHIRERTTHRPGKEIIQIRGHV